jgi:uncharacterized protein YigE (DUF2233 family)
MYNVHPMSSIVSKKLRQKIRQWPRLLLWVVVSLMGCPKPAQTEFREVASGLEYLDASLDGSARAHIFRVDLSHWNLFSVLAKGNGREVATVETLAAETEAAVMLNGGFFDEALAPMGLIISEGKQLVSLRKAADWGVFYVEGARPFLKHTSEVKETSAFSFAVQCGPRILIDKVVPKLKPQVFARTALGVTSDQKVLLLVTYQAPIAADVLGRFFQEKLAATDALLLDGGPSTQLFAKVGELSVSRPGGTGIAHGVGLLPKKKEP